MPEPAAVFACMMVYAIGMWVAWFPDWGLEAHDVVWWPITLVKFLAKTLYLALFTGWRI